MGYVKSFDPIESDPETFTQLMHSIGVSESFQFDDVLDCGDESQQPALALIMIFAESKEDEIRKAAEENQRAPEKITNDIRFLKQTIDNSCGLIAILHCILNSAAGDYIRQDSILDYALKSSDGITAFLESSKDLEDKYRLAMDRGQSDIPDEIKYHYIALVSSPDHVLYELDGERSSPVVRGVSSRLGYILHESLQIETIIRNFARGRTDCFLYKLIQSLE